MICRRCGAEIPDGSDFCAKCGARQTVKAVPTDKKPGGIRELILKFVSKGLILFFMLVVFATSFAGVYKVDGNAAPGVYLKGVEISQSSVQAFAAMVSRYDEDEVSEIYAELQAEVAAIVGNLGAVTSFSASQKRELSEMFSRYNIMKMTISILEIQEDNAAASFSIETLASLESARYTVNLIGALSALHILIAAAGFALAVIDLVFFILNVFAKHKHTQLIGKFAQYAAAASLVAAIMLSLAVTGGGVVYGGALITALVVCPIAMALTFVLDRLTNRTPFALKTLVPQLSAVVGALILVAVFANTSTFSVSVKSASGEGVAARSFVFGILPNDYSELIDFDEEKVEEDALNTLPGYLYQNLEAAKRMNPLMLLYDQAYWDVYSNAMPLHESVSYVYLLFSCSSAVFFGLAYFAVMKGKYTKFLFIPLAIASLCMIFVLADTIVLISGLEETVKFLTLSSVFKVKLGGGAIAGLVFAALTVVPLCLAKGVGKTPRGRTAKAEPVAER